MTQINCLKFSIHWLVGKIFISIVRAYVTLYYGDVDAAKVLIQVTTVWLISVNILCYIYYVGKRFLYLCCGHEVRRKKKQVFVKVKLCM